MKKKSNATAASFTILRMVVCVLSLINVPMALVFERPWHEAFWNLIVAVIICPVWDKK